MVPLTGAVLIGTLFGLWAVVPWLWVTAAGLVVACVGLVWPQGVRLSVVLVVVACSASTWTHVRTAPNHHLAGALDALVGRIIVAQVVVDQWPWGTIVGVVGAPRVSGEVHLSGFERPPGAVLHGPGLLLRSTHGGLHFRTGRCAVTVSWPRINLRGTLQRAAQARLLASPKPSPRELALAQASVLGQRTTAFRRLYKPFRDTGTAHLLAVSGLHLALVASMGLALRRLLGVSPKFDSLILAGTAVLLLVLVDVRPPLARAAVMAIILAIGPTLHRRLGGPTALAAALCLALVLDPEVVTHPGPQLSFTVVAALVWVLPVAEQRARKNLCLGGTWRRAWRAGSIAWLASTPIVMVHFGRAGPFAVPAALAMVPILTLLLGAGWLRILTPPTPLDTLTGFALEHAGSLLLWSADTLAAIPGATWMGPQPHVWWAVLAECIVFMAYLRPGWWVWPSGASIVLLLFVA